MLTHRTLFTSPATAATSTAAATAAATVPTLSSLPCSIRRFASAWFSQQSPYPTSPQQSYQAYAPPSVPQNKPVPSPSPGPQSAYSAAYSTPQAAPQGHYPGPQSGYAPAYPSQSPIPQTYSPSPYGTPAPLQQQGYSQPSPYGTTREPAYGQYGQPQQGYARAPPPPPQNQPYGAPGQQYPPQLSSQGPSYPPQNAPYPGAPGRAPQPGAPSGPPGAAYGPPGGAPAPRATEQQVAAYRQLLIGTIQEKRLQSFWPAEKLDRLVQSLSLEAPAKVSKLVHELAVPQEVAMDIMKLSLFDVILYVDDSGSIEFEERGVRKEQLKQIIEIVASAASTFDDDGISVRFMNNAEQGDGIRNADDVTRLVSRVRFQGLTPLGTGLRNKVLDPMVVGPARQNRLQKPVLVITITDGQPAGEPLDSVANSIGYAVNEVSRTQYGQGAVSFQFSQVGNDTKARDFLSALDEDPQIGALVDCTSNFEVEQDEMSRAVPPVYLTRELWCAKLMLGAIDASYDTKDEKAAGRGLPPSAPPGPPAGQYGGYGQPSYGSQPPSASYGSYNQAAYPPTPGYSQAAYPPNQGQGQAPAPGYGQGYGGGYGTQSPHPAQSPHPSQSPHPGQAGYGQSSTGATRGYSSYGAPAPPRY
ncbi:hypothetical protein BO70DRAFT_200992 [Aspergillus heteromorphus CBS 117.55]|uniref:VWFA domain-containing protein n=1 Tax=Aspergillus heteromorphus CBS 117.55 TaxID=1448321 RepID=A0A317WP00_9EURO|nr:uncharacterized protein BO70DRAFT_200992 [Aspergillus heteromorphus CBS 117.55]PWY87715.1 hypothetical protein BO70DRAFT_200992 [Aspergillus heteromorphus CBS 117.55]